MSRTSDACAGAYYCYSNTHPDGLDIFKHGRRLVDELYHTAPGHRSMIISYSGTVSSSFVFVKSEIGKATNICLLSNYT